MKIKSLYCSCNGRSDNPLTHYERTSSVPCTKLPAPRPALRALLANQLGGSGVAKVKGALSPSRILGCPRESIILDNYEIEGLDLLSGNSMLWGTAMHTLMEQHTLPGEYAEVTIPPEGCAPPVVCGVPMRGRIDALSPDFSEAVDYKFHGELGYKSTLGKKDTEVQLSIYAHMLARIEGGRYPDENIAWHGAMTSAGVAPYRPDVAELLSEEEILAHKPKNGNFAVADIIEEYRNYDDKIAAGIPMDTAVGTLKLVGRKMMNGKKCERYCAAKVLCDGFEARFPQEGFDGDEDYDG